MKRTFKTIAAFIAAITAISCAGISAYADTIEMTNGSYHRFSDSGNDLGIYNGWGRTSKGRLYYKNGTLKKNQWIKDNNGSYYAGADGYVITGFALEKGTGRYRYFDSTGKCDMNYYSDCITYTIERDKSSDGEFSSFGEYFVQDGKKFIKYESFQLMTTDNFTDPLDTVNRALSFMNKYVYTKEDAVKLLNSAEMTGTDQYGRPVRKLSEQVYILEKEQPNLTTAMKKMDKDSVTGLENKLYYVYVAEEIYPETENDVNPSGPSTYRDELMYNNERYYLFISSETFIIDENGKCMLLDALPADLIKPGYKIPSQLTENKELTALIKSKKSLGKLSFDNGSLNNNFSVTSEAFNNADIYLNGRELDDYGLTLVTSKPFRYINGVGVYLYTTAAKYKS